MIQCAKDKGLLIRTGVNAGSRKELQRKYGEPTSDALVESAMRYADILDRYDFQDFVSVKASNVFMTLQAYRKLSQQIEQPLHLGVTEAGTFRSGTVKSAVALGSLLMEGIGDTIRISLAADPVEEVRVGFDILKSLNLRKKGVNIIACPSCSRQNFDVIKTVNELEARLEDINESVDLAVIGCLVNGPGEAREADVGLTGGTPNNLAYRDGEKAITLPLTIWSTSLSEWCAPRSRNSEKMKRGALLPVVNRRRGILVGRGLASGVRRPAFCVFLRKFCEQGSQ